MKKLLVIDCCIREENSRTKKILNAFTNELVGCFETETVNVCRLAICPLNRTEYERRENLLALNKREDPMFYLAKQFASADYIVVAAPFWDMGIPAKLKTYFEHVSVSGFTFKCDENGSIGLCKARRLTYITTRGMDIEDGCILEQASPYLYALTKFFNIDSFDMISAFGLDVHANEADRIVEEAVIRAKALAKSVT